MALDYTARANEIKAVLEGVAGAGKVHNRSRFINDWAKFLDQFKDSAGVINGWEISRADGTPETAPDWTETYQLRKYFGFRDEDATELTFQAHLDAVVRTFRDQPGLSFGAVPYGIKLPRIDVLLFGGVLCHYAEAELAVVIDYDQL